MNNVSIATVDVKVELTSSGSTVTTSRRTGLKSTLLKKIV